MTDDLMSISCVLSGKGQQVKHDAVCCVLLSAFIKKLLEIPGKFVLWCYITCLICIFQHVISPVILISGENIQHLCNSEVSSSPTLHSPLSTAEVKDLKNHLTKDLWMLSSAVPLLRVESTRPAFTGTCLVVFWGSPRMESIFIRFLVQCLTTYITI